jgi:hypothetical protein
MLISMEMHYLIVFNDRCCQSPFPLGRRLPVFNLLDQTPDQSSTSELAIYQQPKILSSDTDVLYINIGLWKEHGWPTLAIAATGFESSPPPYMSIIINNKHII